MKTPSEKSPILEVYYDTDRVIRIRMKDEQQESFDFDAFDSISLNVFRRSNQLDPDYVYQPAFDGDDMLFEVSREDAVEQRNHVLYYELEFTTASTRSVWISNRYFSRNIPDKALIQDVEITLSNELIVLDVEGAVNTAQAVGAAARAKERVEGLTVNDVSELKEGSFDGQVSELLGSRPGTIFWDAESEEDDNGGTIYEVDGVPVGRWKRPEIGYVDPLWFGATADFVGETDDFEPLQRAFNAHTVIDLKGRKYWVSDRIRTRNATIISNGAELHGLPPYTGPVIETADDSFLEAIGNYEDVNEDVGEYTNVIVSSGLASSLSSGDLVKIISDETRGEGDFVGEIQRVINVDGNNIELSGALNDSYTTSDNARVAKVTPNTFNTVGKLKIVHHPDYTAQPKVETDGIRLIHTLNTVADIECEGCTNMAISVMGCFSPIINFTSQNSYSYEPDGARAYGLAIVGATMNGIFKGVVVGSRHAVGCAAGNLAGGIAWNNKVSVIGYSLDSTGVFDAHEGTGSIYFEDCIAVGGSNTMNGESKEASGFILGAKRNYVKNCHFYGYSGVNSDQSVGVELRGGFSPIDIIDVDGLTLHNAMGVFDGSVSNEDLNVKRISFKNVKGNVNFGFVFGGGSGSIEFEDILIDDINLFQNDSNVNSNKGLIRFSANATIPDDITISNIQSDFIHNGTVVVLEKSISSLTLNDVIGGPVLVTCLANAAPDKIHFNRCSMNGGTRAVQLGGGNSIDTIVFNGGNYQNLSDECLAIIPSVTTSVRSISLFGVNAPNIETVIGGSTSASVSGLEIAHISSNDTPQLDRIANVLHDDYVEILSGGGLSYPLIMRGKGSPEGVHTSMPGSLYLDAFSTGTNERIFIKQSGSGNTGWKRLLDEGDLNE